MNKIPSFTIDHTRLLRGIYVSRLDKLGDEYITTFDIRMKAPNREPAMDQAALHTLEHLVATYLRNTQNGENALCIGDLWVVRLVIICLWQVSMSLRTFWI